MITVRQTVSLSQRIRGNKLLGLFFGWGQIQQWLWRQTGWCRHAHCTSVGVAYCRTCGQSVVRLWVLPIYDALTDTRRWEWVAEPTYFNTQQAILMTLPVASVLTP
ncbi:MAG: hypothetical protein U0003_04385 [Vampirovibrionales bacterium]